MTQKTRIARYESKGGAHWVDIYRHPDLTYSYQSNSGGGSALQAEDIVRRVKSGYFLPDAAKTPMKMVYPMREEESE